MHFYWRTFEELKCLGETLIFRDPSLQRNFQQWVVRHALAIALADGYDLERK